LQIATVRENGYIAGCCHLVTATANVMNRRTDGSVKNCDHAIKFARWQHAAMQSSSWR